MPVFRSFLAGLLLFRLFPAFQEDWATVAAQNPSPMVENTRSHERIPVKELKGLRFQVTGVLSKPVLVFVPFKDREARLFDLLLHFHGASHVVEYAASRYQSNAGMIAASVHAGQGSAVYYREFEDPTKFQTLTSQIRARLRERLRRDFQIRKVILSGFSAGYGAVRRLLSAEESYKQANAVLLLDGIHAAYVPQGQVLAEGGKINAADLAVFVKLAREASREDSARQFLITHSEIFPGTFASTTEATDFILDALGLRRVPVLHWGPLGMQQLSHARSHHFAIEGFAGNAAPDHVDHLHALYHFLNRLIEL